MTDMRLIVTGAAGRMGRMLIKGVAETPGLALTGALERPGAPTLGEDAGVVAGLPAKLGVAISDDPLALLLNADGIVDFSAPAATVEMAGLAAQARIAHVIGTTGLSAADLEKIAAAARHAPIVRSGNMSLGVNLLESLVRAAARALGEEFDIEVVEMHHRMKVDAPSGTALMLGEAAAQGRGVELAGHAARGRDGFTGVRVKGDIGFASLRGGTVVGDHSVIFAGNGERITLSHHAEDRSLFVPGALKAALWARGRKPGLYAMADVLGMTESTERICVKTSSPRLSPPRSRERRVTPLGPATRIPAFAAMMLSEILSKRGVLSDEPGAASTISAAGLHAPRYRSVAIKKSRARRARLWSCIRASFSRGGRRTATAASGTC